MLIPFTDFHPDIDRFLYFADSPRKNYEYDDLLKALNITIFSGNANQLNIYSQEEPSALYTQFKVIKPTKSVALPPYYPRYRSLNPYQRYMYLQFLHNPYQPYPDGYKYLLLYCLERRLKEGNQEVIPVMKKLADYHGGKYAETIARSIKGNFCNYTIKSQN